MKPAGRGNAVLILPKGLPTDSPERLLAVGHCGRGLLVPEHTFCRGEGILFGIPAYLDVERIDAQSLHFLVYTFQPPSRALLVERLRQLFGAPHRYDRWRSPVPPRGLCWPLPQGQEVVLYEDYNERDPDLTVSVYSEAAANETRSAMSIAQPCQTQPVVPFGPPP
jgi:hypothetical protein